MNKISATKLGLAASVFALFTACAAPGQTTLSDGSVAYQIECDGTAGGMNYCFERAGKSCGVAGYSIVDRNGQVLSATGVGDSDAEALARAYETDSNSILVRCN